MAKNNDIENLNIIDSILKVNYNNVDNYQKSRLPKFLKYFIFNKRQKDLMRTINKLNYINGLDISTIITFFKRLCLEYPGNGKNKQVGAFGSCINSVITEDDNGNYYCKVEYQVKNEENTGDTIVALFSYFSNHKQNDNKIKYTIAFNNGSLGSFYDKLGSYIYAPLFAKSYDNSFETSISNNKRYIYRNAIFNALKNDIIEYLKLRVNATYDITVVYKTNSKNEDHF